MKQTNNIILFMLLMMLMAGCGERPEEQVRQRAEAFYMLSRDLPNRSAEEAVERLAEFIPPSAEAAAWSRRYYQEVKEPRGFVYVATQTVQKVVLNETGDRAEVVTWIRSKMPAGNMVSVSRKTAWTNTLGQWHLIPD